MTRPTRHLPFDANRDLEFRPLGHWSDVPTESEQERGDVQIALIALQSVSSDIVEVCAARNGNEIRYAVVDEYETEFDVQPDIGRTAQPR